VVSRSVQGIVHGGERSTLIGSEEWYGYGCDFREYWEVAAEVGGEYRTMGSQCAGSREDARKERECGSAERVKCEVWCRADKSVVGVKRSVGF